MNDYIAEASYYRMTATVFRENARMLLSQFEAEGLEIVGNRMAVPYYYLISHCMELYLKCALLKRGASPDQLKDHKVRHNLESLLKKLQEKEVPITEMTLEIVNSLSKQHSNHSLRYSVFFDDGSKTSTPSPQDIEIVLDELLMAGRGTSVI